MRSLDHGALGKFEYLTIGACGYWTIRLLGHGGNHGDNHGGIDLCGHRIVPYTVIRK